MARRRFFSFHYQDVIDFRANVVRNHNVTKDDNGDFFDASIWESAKNQGEIALKRLINDNAMFSIVAASAHKFSRPRILRNTPGSQIFDEVEFPANSKTPS